MSIGGPKDFNNMISVGRIIGNGTKDSPTGIVDSTQSGLQQVSFPEWGDSVDPQHIALSTNLNSKPHSNKRPFDNGQLVYALRTSGRTDCIILGPAGDILDTQNMPGNFNLNKFLKNTNAIENISKTIRIKPKRVNARGNKTEKPDPNTEFYKHALKNGITTASELAQMAGFKMPSIGNIPTAVQQFSNILNPSSFGSIPGMNMNLGSSLKKINDEDKKKIQDAIPPSLWEVLNSLISSLDTISDNSIVSYVSDRRVNEEVFIKNAVELLTQVTSVSDIMAAFDRLLSDETLYGLDELDDIVIDIETAFGNVQQIISANGYLGMNVSNTVANTRSSQSSAMSSAASYPAGLGQNVFGRDSGQIFDMINRMAPQAQAKAMQTLKNAAPTTKNKHSMNNSHTPTSGNGTRKPLGSITIPKSVFDPTNFAGS